MMSRYRVTDAQTYWSKSKPAKPDHDWCFSLLARASTTLPCGYWLLSNKSTSTESSVCLMAMHDGHDRRKMLQVCLWGRLNNLWLKFIVVWVISDDDSRPINSWARHRWQESPDISKSWCNNKQRNIPSTPGRELTLDQVVSVINNVSAEENRTQQGEDCVLHWSWRQKDLEHAPHHERHQAPEQHGAKETASMQRHNKQVNIQEAQLQQEAGKKLQRHVPTWCKQLVHCPATTGALFTGMQIQTACMCNAHEQ